MSLASELEGDQAVTAMERNAARLQGLVDDLLLLAVSPRASGARRPVEVAQLVRDVRDRLTPADRTRQLRLTVDPAGDPGGELTLAADPDQLRHALTHLVDNGLKFTPADGWVDVRVRCGAREIDLVVTDTGVGIDPADQQRVFDRFYRTAHARRHAVPGTGLGLAVVHAVAQHHGGRVALWSAPGEGTRVTLTLPRD